MADKEKYLIKIQGKLIEVSEDVYYAYFRMERQERWQEEKKQEHDVVSYIVEQKEKQTESDGDRSVDIMKKIHQSVQRIGKWWLIWKGGGRRWRTML